MNIRHPQNIKTTAGTVASTILHGMDTSGRMHTSVDGRGGGNKSNGTFNTAPRMIEPTPISPVLLKHTRHDLPYPHYCFDSAREGTAVGVRLTEVVCGISCHE